MDTTDQLIDRVEKEIREGRDETARLVLEAGFPRAKFQADARFRSRVRSHLPELARLYRRLGLANVSLRLLHHLVRPTEKRPTIASPAERAEYAIALLREGASFEASKILQEIDVQAYPPAALYRAAARFMDWDYFTSAAELRGLYANTDWSYRKAVIGVNLLSSLIYTKSWIEADDLAREIATWASENQAWVIEGNVQEILTQLHFFRRDYREANHSIARATALMSQRKNVDRLYLDRWVLLFPYLIQKRPRAFGAEILQFTSLAMKRGDPEAARAIRFQFLERFPKDDEVFHLYQCHPGASYRKVLDQFFVSCPELKIKKFYHLESQARFESSKNLRIEFLGDAIEFAARGKNICVDLTRSESELFHTLIRDPYRLQTVPALHHQVSGGSWFNPQSSANAVRQVILRLKRKLEKSGFPLDLRFVSNRGYALLGPFSLRFRVENLQGFPSGIPPEFPDSRSQAAPALNRAMQYFLENLREARLPDPFRLRDIRLDIPRRTLKRYLSQAVRAGALIAEGKGAQTVYRLSPVRSLGKTQV